MPSKKVNEIRKQLREVANAEIAEHSQRFFKTGPGEYGEGDKFIGVRVPVLRKLAKANREASLKDATVLLQSKVHEERLLALLLLVYKYERSEAGERKEIFELYCENLRYVNNWDLVDCSAHYIVGEQLREQSKKQLFKWARSKDLWERRISIISTYAYIKTNEFGDTLELAEILLDDKEDLIHKAVGWMLREVGNRDRKVEEAFLKPHYQQMPRTMLRYAIEKFPERRRKQYLHGKV